MSATVRRERASSYLGSLELSWSAIGVYACASVIGGFITLAPSGVGTTRVLIAVFTATMLAVLMVAGLRELLYRLFEGRPLVRVFAFLISAAIVGASRGLVLTELSTGRVADTSQIVASVWSAILWLSLGTALFAGRDRYQRRYRALVLQSQAPTTTDWDTHPSVRQVKVNVSQAIDAADADVLAVARVIREEIESNIRPLSHRLWFGSDGDVPRARWNHLVRDALASFTVPVGVVSTIWFIGGLTGGTQLFGLVPGILSALFSTLFLVVSVFIVRRYLPRGAGWGLVEMTLISALTIFGSDSVLIFLGFPSKIWESPSLLILLPLTVLGLLVVSSAISLAEADRTIILKVAENTVRANATALNNKRDSAFLHNSFQAELTGLALQLEQAANSGSAGEAKEALERVHAMLARSVSEDFREVVEAPHERLLRVVAAWQGLCEVRIQLEEGVTEAPQFPLAVQVAEEVIANAVRHGGAKEVSLTFTSHNGRLRVIGETDSPMSSTPMSSGGAGLGSHVLSAVSHAGAVVSDADGRSTMRVELE